VRERWPADVEGHQLADAIAMTAVTTRVVGDAGASFVPLVVESSGRQVFDIVDAYLRAQRLARAAATRKVLEELRASVAMQSLSEAWVQVDAGCRDVTTTWLSPGERVPTDAEIDEMAEAVDEVYAQQAEEVVKRNAGRVAMMLAADTPEDVARLVIKASYLDIALMVWWHAKKLGASFHDVVVRQLAAGRASRLQEIIDDLQDRPAKGEWEPIAVQVLATRFIRLLRELVLRLGTVHQADTVDTLEPMLVEGILRDVRAQVDTMLPLGTTPDLATLLVLEERLAGAVARLPRA
jgi:NAD-specific glutamate dehydrogenase